MESKHEMIVRVVFAACCAAVCVSYIISDFIIRRETLAVRAMEVSEMLQRTQENAMRRKF
jgi:hypothetical protein